MNLHVHIYDEASEEDDNLIEEKDLEPSYDYIDTDFPYIQYGFERNGEWFEIRVPVPPGQLPSGSVPHYE